MKREPSHSQIAASIKSVMSRDGKSLATAAVAAIPVLHSQQLFSVNNEVLIKHAGSVYRLRITHANKLILTK